MGKKFISAIYYKYFYYSSIGYRFRQYFRESEIAGIKPLSKNSVISDLFVYRKSNVWGTTFQLFNISSILFPEYHWDERCEIYFWGSKGNFIKSINVTLTPFELKTLDFNYVDNLEEAGTFAVFHFSDILSKISEKESCLTERGYIAYKYKNSPLNSYCHGNLQSLSKKQHSKIKSVAAVSKQNVPYYPQMIFSDCDSFDLIFTNPTNTQKAIKIELIDSHGNCINTSRAEIKSLGVEILSFENTERNIHTTRHYGQIMMWRPLVKKFYDTHFDVLHG